MRDFLAKASKKTSLFQNFTDKKLIDIKKRNSLI